MDNPGFFAYFRPIRLVIRVRRYGNHACHTRRAIVLQAGAAGRHCLTSRQWHPATISPAAALQRWFETRKRSGL